MKVVVAVAGHPLQRVSLQTTAEGVTETADMQGQVCLREVMAIDILSHLMAATALLLPHWCRKERSSGLQKGVSSTQQCPSQTCTSSSGVPWSFTI